MEKVGRGARRWKEGKGRTGRKKGREGYNGGTGVPGNRGTGGPRYQGTRGVGSPGGRKGARGVGSPEGGGVGGMRREQGG